MNIRRSIVVCALAQLLFAGCVMGAGQDPTSEASETKETQAAAFADGTDEGTDESSDIVEQPTDDGADFGRDPEARWTSGLVGPSAFGTVPTMTPRADGT